MTRARQLHVQRLARLDALILHADHRVRRLRRRVRVQLRAARLLVVAMQRGDT